MKPIRKNPVKRGVALRLSAVAIVGLGICTMAPTCGDEIVVPVSDTTPPGVVLFYGHDGSTQEVPAAGLVTTVDEGEVFSLMLVGQDNDGGVAAVNISGSARRHCIDPDGELGQIMNELIVIPDIEYLGPGEVGYTGMYVTSEFTASCHCSSGFECTHSEYSLIGSAHNHHGLTTYSPRVSVEVNCAETGGDPGDPLPCRPGEVCCEPTPTGGCLICRPRGTLCP